MTRHWHVVLDSGTSLDIGPWKAPMHWGGTVEAEDRTSAVTAAREQCRASMGDTYADGRVVEVEELHLWKVTLRGRHDKRRRESFTTRAATEHEAIRNVSYLPAAYRFAGSGIMGARRGRENKAVVKVEQTT